MTHPQQPEYGAPQPPMSKKEARAQAASRKAYEKSQRSWFARHKILTGLAAFILLIFVFSLAGGGDESADTVATDDSSDTAAAPETEEPAAEDPAEPETPAQPEVDEAAQNITITNCGVTDLGGTKFADVAYTIDNPTSESSDYFFQIALIDSTGASVSQATGIEPNVLPGRPSQGEASGNVSDSAVGPYTCEVSDVTRTASN